jgi:hypothetical protein
MTRAPPCPAAREGLRRDVERGTADRPCPVLLLRRFRKHDPPLCLRHIAKMCGAGALHTFVQAENNAGCTALLPGAARTEFLPSATPGRTVRPRHDPSAFMWAGLPRPGDPYCYIRVAQVLYWITPFPHCFGLPGLKRGFVGPGSTLRRIPLQYLRLRGNQQVAPQESSRTQHRGDVPLFVVPVRGRVPWTNAIRQEARNLRCPHGTGTRP